MKNVKNFDISNAWYSIDNKYLGIVQEGNLKVEESELLIYDSNMECIQKVKINFIKGYFCLSNNSAFFFDSSLNYLCFFIENNELHFVREYDGKFILNPNAGNFFVSDLHKFDSSNQVDNSSIKSFYENEKEIWRNDFFGNVIEFFGNLILCFTDPNKQVLERKNNQFSRLSFETGERVWDFDIEQHRDKIISAYPYTDMFEEENATTDVKEPIGVYKDQLWFSMTHYGLLCLNYHTGEFKHYLRDCHQNDIRYGGLPYGNYPVIPYTENAVILESEGKMVCFDGMYYWELNLETLVLDFHYLQNYFQEVNCSTYLARSKKLIVEADNIYMVDNKNKKFACFSRSKLKYNWIESLSEGSGAPRAIEKHGNRLYIDTTKNQLLVYELDGDE